MTGLRIDPRYRWVDTGIDVSAGQTLVFRASGKLKDWYIPTDADGFAFNPAGLFARRRYPQHNWLALLGALDRDPDGVFPIGLREEKLFNQSGRLFVFVNDHDSDFAYGNNKGVLSLTVTVGG